MASIYELNGDYLRLLAMLEDPELDQQTLADTMEGIEGEYEEKAENYGKVIKNEEGDINALKAEKERITRLIQTKENNIKRMKEALLYSMEITGKTKIKTALFSFTICKNAPSVVIDAADIRDIPEDYLKFKEPEVDKTAIKNAINAGVDFEGLAHLEVSQSLRIR